MSDDEGTEEPEHDPATLVAVERAEASRRRNRQTNIAMLAMVGVTCLVLMIGGLALYVKIDAKVSHIDQTATKIRTTQKANTVVAGCELRAFNQVLTEIFHETDIVAPPQC